MRWRCGSFSFDATKPVLMGVLNLTPDSFSDGGQYSTFEAALDQAHRLRDEGAQIIDVGGESTRPGASPLAPEEECARVLEVVRKLAEEGLCVSIDTRHAQVAQACLEAGASIVNDVSGFSDPAMLELVRKSDCGLVLMHMQGEPATMQDEPHYTDVVTEVADWLKERCTSLEKEGISPERLCIDPGPGFGKTPQQTLELVRNFQEFAHLGYPLMAALSRKSYIGYAYKIDKPTQRDEASATEALMACELGASVVRTHNVGQTAQALRDLRPQVVLSIGCNVALVANPGEERDGKIAVLNQAISMLCTLPDTQIIDISSFYESEPAYYEEQDSFINAVIIMRTGLPPAELLKYLQAIENSLGRVRDIPNGPRTCDLDIVDYQLYVIENEVLSLPHPRALERDFVVQPLLELRPRFVFADGSLLTTDSVRVGKSVKI